MIRLFESQLQGLDRQSSKGNQLKWKDDPYWYKADYTGYEALSEYMVSHLLQFSDMKTDEYVLYEIEEIEYRQKSMSGARSRNFLEPGWQLITLERMYRNHSGKSLTLELGKLDTPESRLKYLVETVEAMTGLKNFGVYMCKVLTVDCLFLNEDRHMHNLGILMNREGQYRLCPLFDHGAALLADTTMDYPLEGDPLRMIHDARAKSIAGSFDDQLTACETLYGRHILFSFTRKDIQELLEKAPLYSEVIKTRVMDILLEQRRKYGYLFK